MSWLVDTLVTTGALIALVLVLRRPVARLFGPGIAYALWLLPLLRLALPPLVLPAPATPLTYVASADAVTRSGAAAVNAQASAVLLPALMALWLGGAVLFLGWRFGSYLRMRQRVLRAARPVATVGAIRVVESAQVAMPVAFGVFDKVVALPAGFLAGTDPLSRDLALAHELEHHAGRDLAVNFAMQPLLALHWFNPLAWSGWKALRRDQEAACDARVLAGRDAATRAAYGRLIADFARGPQPALASPMACAVLAEKTIVHRLRSLTMSDLSQRRRLAGRLLIAAGVLALPLTASISYATSDEPPAPTAAGQQHVEKHVVIVEKEGPATPDGKLKVRTVTRDGKTVVFKTDKDLSDEEIDRKVDEALASAPVPPETPATPGERRVIVRRIGTQGDARAMAIDTETVEGTGCKNGQPTEVNESSDADGKRHQIRIKICARDYAAKTATEALRSARDEVARDQDIPADVRDKVLKQLDEEIARASGQG